MEKFRIDDNFDIQDAHIFTRDGKNLLAFVNPTNSSKNTSENEVLIEQIDSLIAKQAQLSEEVTVEYYGGTAVAVANAKRVKKDIILTVSIALVLILLFSYIVFRKLRVFLLLFLPVALGAGVSISLLYLIEGEISAIALGIGGMLLGISIDYSLHFFSHYKEEGSVKDKLRILTEPIIMSSITTASAFLCLLIVRSEALKQLGLFAAFSVLLSAFFVLTLLPSLLKPAKKEKAKAMEPNFFDRLAAVSFHKKKYLVIVILLLSVVFLFTSQNISFRSDITKLNYLSDKLAKAEEGLNKISSETQSSVFLSCEGKSLNEALMELEKNEIQLEILKREGLFQTRSSVTDIMLSEEKQKEKIEKWNQFWKRNSKERIENTIREEGVKNKFKSNAFHSFFSLLKKEYKVVELDVFDRIGKNILSNYISKTDSTYLATTIVKVQSEKKDEFFEAFTGNKELIVFDQQYFTKAFIQIIKEDFNMLVSLSLIIVFLVLLMFFGRIELSLVAFIPILLSWLWTLGLMGLFGLEFNIFNVIISTFVFGLGIDYCIFMTRGLINQHKYGNKSLSPFRLSIMFSTVTTVTGIGVLYFAHHPALKSIALVSVFGILSSILMAYIILPILFSWLVRSKYNNQRPPITFVDVFTSLLALSIFLVGSGLLSGIIPILLILPLRMKTKKYIFHVFIRAFFVFVVKAIFTISDKVLQKEKLDFTKPGIIVCNHQSHLDLALILMLHPKILVLTNKWVWNNPIYGLIVRFADFFPTYKGVEHKVDEMKKKVEEGYSILVFPEGTRSEDGSIKRFHQGAFYLADQLGVDLQPILIHGADYCLNKREFFLRSGQINLKVLDRIKVEPIAEGETYRLQAKAVTKSIREQFTDLRKEIEQPAYYRNRLIGNFLYKGPVLEWYLKVKFSLEKSYEFFHKHIPAKGKIVDVGCGYGFLAQTLKMVSPEREFLGLDYDEEKIAMAQNAVRSMEGISFQVANVVEYNLPESDVFIINDVLHYLTEEQQEIVIVKCMEKLNAGGTIFIRDADSDLEKRTKVTKLTEFFSVKLLRFNTDENNRLTYTSGRKIKQIAESNGFSCTRIDNVKHTSNLSFLLKRNGSL